MGNYSLVELSHDFCPPRDEAELLKWASGIRRYLGSGQASELPQGVRLKVRDCHPLLERVEIRPYEYPRRQAMTETTNNPSVGVKPDASGYYARPLCPFCSAPFSDDMIYVWDESFSVPSDPEPPDIQIEIQCDSCGRVIYRKGGLSQ